MWLRATALKIDATPERETSPDYAEDCMWISADGHALSARL